jgi:hypothetical protein
MDDRFHGLYYFDLDDRSETIGAATHSHSLLIEILAISTETQRSYVRVYCVPSRRAETLGHSQIFLNYELLTVLINFAWHHLLFSGKG